jgi:hypothetical protein
MATKGNPPPVVDREKIDATAYIILKAAKKLEGGSVSSVEFLTFTLAQLGELGIARAGKSALPINSPTTEEQPT